MEIPFDLFPHLAVHLHPFTYENLLRNLLRLVEGGCARGSLLFFGYLALYKLSDRDFMSFVPGNGIGL
jgi:hypothetical protein